MNRVSSKTGGRVAGCAASISSSLQTISTQFFHDLLNFACLLSFCNPGGAILPLYNTVLPFSQCYALPSFLIAFHTRAYCTYNPQVVPEYLLRPSS